MFSQAKRYPFTAWAISGAPDDPGVYILWRGDELVYIGSAGGAGANIRSRLIEHFTETTQGGANPVATSYSWELSRNPRVREAELIEEYRRAFERLPLMNAAR